jgi:hypothetical protein
VSDSRTTTSAIYRSLRFTALLPVSRQYTRYAVNGRIGLKSSIEPKLAYCRLTQLITADYVRNRREIV